MANRYKSSRPRSASEDDVIDLLGVDMGDPNNTGWFRVTKSLAEKVDRGENRIGNAAARKEYARVMRDGGWEDYSGSAFYFDRSGRARRGFHRMDAVIEADAEIIVWVYCGSPESRIGVDDSNQPWNTHDYMTQKTGKSKKSLAEVAFNTLRACRILPRGHRTNNGPACGEFYDEYSELYERVESKLARIDQVATRRKFSNGVPLAVYWLINRDCPEHLDRILDAIANTDSKEHYNFSQWSDKVAPLSGGKLYAVGIKWMTYAIVKFLRGERVSDQRWSLEADLASLTIRDEKPDRRTPNVKGAAAARGIPAWNRTSRSPATPKG